MAPDHVVWRWLNIAVVAALGAAVVSYRANTGELSSWMLLELSPLIAILPLIARGGRKAVVISMLIGMLYILYGTVVGTDSEGRWFGVGIVVLTLALFGTLFVLGRKQLADERAANP